MRGYLFEYNASKNSELKRKRGVSFEDIIVIIDEQPEAVTFKKHPNEQRYPTQQIMEVNINGYIYLVPCLVEKERIFLKTVYPSRKATKAWKGEQSEKKGRLPGQGRTGNNRSL